MKLSEEVLVGIDDVLGGRYDAGLLHACITIDATARRLFPSMSRVGARYRSCLRQYYWLLEPMVGAGLNLEETRFSNVVLERTSHPDFAEIVYEVFRCSHAHGDEVPAQFAVNSANPEWLLAKNELHVPSSVVWALFSIAVLSKVNADQTTSSEHFLSLSDERFPIRDWWGREDDFRSIAARHNQTRVTIHGLANVPPRSSIGDYVHMAKLKPSA
jgi:hypothetical protein